MTFDVKICFAYKSKTQSEKACKNLISEIITGLKQQGKSEFGAIGKIKDAYDIRDADFIIGDPSHDVFDADYSSEEYKNLRPVPAVVLLTEDIWGEAVNAVSKNPLYDIRAIFRFSKLSGEPALRDRDPEEFGKLSEVVKNLLRHVLRKNGLHEQDFTKPINWKIKIASECNTEFISLFSTPAMQNMARKYKDALLSINEPLLRDLRKRLHNNNKDKETLEQRITEIRNFFVKNSPDKNYSRVPSALILGETGCGKSLLAGMAAKVIMPDKELTRINIASYNQDSIDTLLFGAEQGSYTDSDKDRPGLFIGHCGEVVFLDEIGDMPPDVQARLLIYMDSAQVLPRGMNTPVCAPCILIAATNKDLKHDASFRKDILNRFEHVIEIPSLKERRQDLRLLISMILQDQRINRNGKVECISLDALNYLEEREYFGNFRELRFCLAQAVNNAFSEGVKCLCLRHFLGE